MKLLTVLGILCGSFVFATSGPVPETTKHLYSGKYNKHFFFGLKPHKKKLFFEIDKRFLHADLKIPADFNMMQKWPLPCGIFDQGQCGSCVYNSVTQNYQYSLSIRKLLPAGSCPLAREQLMNCIPNGGQCDGDYAENVGSGLVGLKGLVPDSAYPYTGRSENCRNINAQKIGPIVSGAVIDNSQKSMASAMVQGIPVSITIGADNPFMDYEKGTYTTCTNAGTNHEVLLVGIHCAGTSKSADGFCIFDETGNGKPTEVIFDVVNSWNESWGDHGVIHMLAMNARGQRCNNVAEEAYTLDTGIPLPIDIPVSCTMKVTPPTAQANADITVTLNSVNAVTADIAGKAVPVPAGSVAMKADPTVGFHNIPGSAVDAKGNKAQCEANYTVTFPPTPDPNVTPWWVWLFGGLGLVIITLLVVNLTKKASKP